MKLKFLAITITVISVLAACTKKASPGKTNEVIRTSFTADMVPLMQAKCTPCHLASKGGKMTNFENYETAKKYGNDILARVLLNPGQKGFMPFKHEKLSEAEIAVIKKWTVDGLLEK